MSKTVLITGASAGIGKLLTEKFIKRSWKVLGVDRDESGLREIEENHGDNFVGIIQDLTAIDSYQEFILKIEKEYGLPHLWINNAGIAKVAPFNEVSEEVFDKVFKINFEVMAKFTNSLIPAMEQRGFGEVMNIASVAGHVPCPFISSYSASKFAIVGLTQSIQAELDYKKSPVKLYLVSPGFINSTSLFKSESLGVFQSSFEKLSSDMEQTVNAIMKSYEKGEQFISPTLNGELIMKMNRVSPKLSRLMSRLVSAKNIKQALGLEKIERL